MGLADYKELADDNTLISGINIAGGRGASLLEIVGACESNKKPSPGLPAKAKNGVYGKDGSNPFVYAAPDPFCQSHLTVRSYPNSLLT